MDLVQHVKRLVSSPTLVYMWGEGRRGEERPDIKKGHCLPRVESMFLWYVSVQIFEK